MNNIYKLKLIVNGLFTNNKDISGTKNQHPVRDAGTLYIVAVANN
jgi:hypothetical protein